ncbi:MAG: hypothetical protein WCT18_02150 [Patescibacteria group bacterium]
MKVVAGDYWLVKGGVVFVLDSAFLSSNLIFVNQVLVDGEKRADIYLPASQFCRKLTPEEAKAKIELIMEASIAQFLRLPFSRGEEFKNLLEEMKNSEGGNS